jgi:hypothetical protein
MKRIPVRSIPRGNRAGRELWIGPIGLSLTWPPRSPLAWNWGWWQPHT